MSITRNVNIKIKGQVPDDYGDRDYEILLAELRVICAKYGLELTEEWREVKEEEEDY